MIIYNLCMFILCNSNSAEVQKYSIPIVLSGRDLMACAQTGSGLGSTRVLKDTQKHYMQKARSAHGVSRQHLST